MMIHDKESVSPRPKVIEPLLDSGQQALAAHKDKARRLFKTGLTYCEHSEQSFAKFEVKLFPLMAVLGRLLIHLFLLARHHRLDLEPHLKDGKH